MPFYPVLRLIVQELNKREVLLLKKQEFQNKRVKKLLGKRQLLLVAYLDKAFPLDLLKEEQNKIADALLTAETRLEELTATNDEVEETIYLAISMLLIAMKLTKKGSPKTKRMFNQALFKKIYLNGKKASNHEFAEPFDVIFFSKFK